jgi:rsbT antagonist protein RsbS
MGAASGVAVFSLVRGCLVATPLRELDPAGVRAFHAELSARLQRERGLHGVVLDVSAVEVMDADDFAWVRATLQLAALMGSRAVLAGLSPEVAATLVRLDVDVHRVEAAHTVDRAVDALERAP